MATAKYDNVLYEQTKALINLALPMEWTIRALQISPPFQALRTIDIRLHDFWRQNEFNDVEIIAFELKDHSWDTLQVGRFCSRAYTQVYNQKVLDRIHKGIKEATGLLEKEVSEISLPSIAKDYRYCDLLNGNDIPRLLNKIQSIKENLDKFAKDDSIPFSEFATFVRVPTKIYNESLITDGSGTESNGRRLDHAIMFKIRTDVQIKDFQGILDEFTLEYCKKRINYLGNHPEVRFDDLPTKLITDVFSRKMFDAPNIVVDRHDGLIGHLVGLYYWDSVQKDKNIKSNAIEGELRNDFNVERDQSTIRKDYKTTRKKIEDLIYEMKGIGCPPR
ncbi:hypothetical protein [Methylobacter svalbardensis]|uniref:hypothetical protein n=1 Tax=Methylobacter svalbardensis TaxID=3080016 RepID=UPI0030EE7ECC